jgi:hypothetical protein
MKKLFAGIVVSIMLVGMMGTTVFAAGSGSPTSETALKKEASDLSDKIASVTAKDANGNPVSIVKSAIENTGIMVWGQNEAKKLGTNAQVLAMTDLTVSGNNSKGSVTVTLNVERIRSGDNIHVYHYNATKKTWEDLNSVSGSNVTVTDGAVVVTMSSFSPVMVVYVQTTTAAQNNSNQNSTQDSTQNSTEADTQNGSSNSAGDYTQGYNDGYEAGVNSVSNISSGTSSNSSKKSSSKNNSSTNKSSSGSSTVTRTIYRNGNTTSSTVNTSTTSPKTGASLPALPFVAMFAFAGLLVCNKKRQNQ